jgi:asparagine synthase (glutamine-hydrolysing)
VTAESPARDREESAWRMVRELAHRGPDGQAVVSVGPATFGVARLSIVDRATAHQPMTLSYGGQQGLIAYNGEVYNFKQLRSEFEALGLQFHRNSDTETVLGGHLALGIQAVQQFDGMFAYAVWEEPRGRLVLLRDRFGIKPLFYVDLGHTLLFASEPKAFFCHPSLQRHPNFTAILEYFLHGAAFAAGYTTADRSFFKGVKALPPGHSLTWTPSGESKLIRYWSPLDEMPTLRTDENGAREELGDNMSQSVQSMLMGEVPVGTALSGGLDSSLITAEAAHAMSEPLVSACITYRATADDGDAHHASLLSRQLNEKKADSHRLEFTYLPEATYLDALDEMVRAFDEPHWEPRQLAMFANYRTLAQSGRTVVLTGEGADELFFGYYQKFPGFRSPAIASAAGFADLWRERLPLVRGLFSPAFNSGLFSDSLANDLIDSSVSTYLTPYWEATGDRLRAVQSWYLHTFLPWLLLDNDRCSMAHSIEGRFPFLSRQIVSLALQSPPEWNIPSFGSPGEKLLLRQAAAGRLPVEIWRDRAKSPLPIPNNSSYAAAIVRRLRLEIEIADPDIWQILDRARLLAMVEEFEHRMRSLGAESGEALTSYIALGAVSRVRTAELFALLTFLRWYDLYFVRARKDSPCPQSELQTL